MDVSYIPKGGTDNDAVSIDGVTWEDIISEFGMQTVLEWFIDMHEDDDDIWDFLEMNTKDVVEF